MAKVRVKFEDFVDLLDDSEYGHHFETRKAEDGEILLLLFIDGNPSDWEMSIRSTRVEVAKETEL